MILSEKNRLPPWASNLDAEAGLSRKGQKEYKKVDRKAGNKEDQINILVKYKKRVNKNQLICIISAYKN